MARQKPGHCHIMKQWWLSSIKMTFMVTTKCRAKKEIIIKSAPIASTFIGQPLTNLIKWMKKQGGLRVYLYKEPHAHSN